MLIESPRCDRPPHFPDGTPIEGHIQSVHKVGMGFRHEIATLEIEFDRIEPDGAPSDRACAPECCKWIMRGNTSKTE